jgi:riboflavin synthase
MVQSAVDVVALCSRAFPHTRKKPLEHAKQLASFCVPDRTTLPLAQLQKHTSISTMIASSSSSRVAVATQQQRRHRSHASIAPNSRRLSRHHALRVVSMFTGIVQGMAKIVDVQGADNFSRLQVQLPPGRAAGIAIGASVAINGTCLTVTDISPDDTLAFDVMGETLRATTLGDLAPGGAVNYERSARVGDEIGGHTVSGHVHTTAAVERVDDSPNNRRVQFKLADARWAKYVLPKGFIAVDGCSLTVGEVEPDGGAFSVYLIPETMRVTVLGSKVEGARVNIEIEAQTQAIVDTVERVVAQYAASGALGGGGGGVGVGAAAAVAATAAAARPS